MTPNLLGTGPRLEGHCSSSPSERGLVVTQFWSKNIQTKPWQCYVLEAELFTLFASSVEGQSCETDGVVTLYLVASCGNTNQQGALRAFHCHSITVQAISLFAAQFRGKSSVLSAHNFDWQRC